MRLSVTALESLRFWKDKEGSTLDDLIAELTKKFEPTPQMEAGKALARLFENASGRDLNEETQDGWTFRFALEDEFTLPPLRELKAEVEMQTPSGPVTLVGKVDGLDGLTVTDEKLSENWDPERYTESLQWRSYLTMFQARKFVYHIFVAKYEREKGHQDADGNYVKGAIKPGICTITEYHPLTFYGYPNMAADVQRAVNELADIYSRYILPRAA